MIRKIIKVVLFLTLSFSFATSQAYMTYGVKGCGSLINDVDRTSDKDKFAKDLTEATVMTWLAGYISAYNSWLAAVSKKENSNIIASTDMDGVYRSVVNYCRTNPLKNVNDAINDTLEQLRNPPKRSR